MGYSLSVDGFLNLHKPYGFTSHDCVAKVRRLLRLKRVGHSGTLDPAATGVLPIALGRATRLLQYLRQGKAYRATIRFGLTTTTDDLEGDVVSQEPTPALTLAEVEALLPKFQGLIHQIPPAYSAIQVQGKRLYDLARQGETVEIPSRTVEVHQIEVLTWRSGDFPELELAIACGPGTYIRSIARDLGQLLGVGATLAGLVRTQSNGFGLDSSLTLEQLTEQVQAEAFVPLSPEVALSHLPSLTLEADLARRWCQGQKLKLAAPADRWLRIQAEGDRFLGVGQVSSLPEGGYLLIPAMVFEPIST